MGKHSRVTAIILAAALVLNMINVPVYAEQSESGSFHVETNASATLSSPSETSAQDAGITGETGSAEDETDSAASGSHNASDETGTNAGE
ncbi:MAG: hypothetical protein PUC98_06290, partial [Clostridiales bacterium]|nr:hypothetical protein [Clostridiales bacterium]